MAFCALVMFQVYYYVYQTESRTRCYTQHGISNDEAMQMTNQVKKQSLLYVSVFIISTGNLLSYCEICTDAVYSSGFVFRSCLDVPNYIKVRCIDYFCCIIASMYVSQLLLLHRRLMQLFGSKPPSILVVLSGVTIGTQVHFF